MWLSPDEQRKMSMLSTEFESAIGRRPFDSGCPGERPQTLEAANKLIDDAVGDAIDLTKCLRLAATHAAVPTVVKFTRVDLSNNRLTPQPIERLAQAIRGEESNLTDLSLYGNMIGDAGVAALAAALNESGLVRINLGRNRLTSAAARSLAKGITDNERLKELSLAENEMIGSMGVNALAKCFNKSVLQRLSLARVGLGDGDAAIQEGVAALAAGVMLCTTLESLSLSDNAFEFEEMQALGSALKAHVTHLDVSQTFTDPNAFDELVEAAGHLLTLNVSKNTLTSRIAHDEPSPMGLFAEKLGNNELKLRTVVMQDCGLWANTVRLLATALKTNDTLEVLRLDKNQGLLFDDLQGVPRLRYARDAFTSLVNAIEQNHNSNLKVLSVKNCVPPGAIYKVSNGQTTTIPFPNLTELVEKAFATREQERKRA